MECSGEFLERGQSPHTAPTVSHLTAPRAAQAEDGTANKEARDRVHECARL